MKDISVTVRRGEDTFRTTVGQGERADRILLRSLENFGIDLDRKGEWRLRHRDQERTDHGVYLDRTVNEQMTDGAELVLEPRDAAARNPATGSY